MKIPKLLLSLSCILILASPLVLGFWSLLMASLVYGLALRFLVHKIDMRSQTLQMFAGLIIILCPFVASILHAAYNGPWYAFILFIPSYALMFCGLVAVDKCTKPSVSHGGPIQGATR